MKPVIKVWCLPPDVEDHYNDLHQAIVRAVVALNVGISDQNDMVVLMPTDLMKMGLGEEIIVEIDSARVEQNRILDAVLGVIKVFYPKAYRQGSFTYAHETGHLYRLHVTLQVLKGVYTKTGIAKVCGSGFVLCKIIAQTIEEPFVPS